MDQHLILWPLLAQIFLTLFMYGRLALVKKREFAAGNVDTVKTALHESAWPESVIKVNNNLRNQFETPILFYFLCFLLWALRGVDTAVMVVASVYVLTRFAHATIHTTSNIVKYRLIMFTTGMVLLTVLFGFTVKTLSAL